MNAMYNRAAGKGYEAEAFYPNTKFVFKGIENIHVMRDSLAKLVDACETKSETMETFLQGIFAWQYSFKFSWPQNIKNLLFLDHFS